MVVGFLSHIAELIILTGEDPVRLIDVVVWFQAEREEGE